MRIIEHARCRMNMGSKRGWNPEPWKDAERDFVGETLEELADAWNYLTWDMRQKGFKIKKALALICVVMAYKLTGGSYENTESNKRYNCNNRNDNHDDICNDEPNQWIIEISHN